MVTRSDITWKLGKGASKELADFRKLSPDEYAAEKTAMQEFLCDYFNTHETCNLRHGNSIFPVAGGDKLAKRLKVKWVRPGSGKRGGYRLLIDAFCTERRVVVISAELRRDVE